MHKAVVLVVLSAFLVLPTVLTQTARAAEDPNLQAAALTPRAAKMAQAAEMAQMVDQLMASGALTDPNLCAVIVLPGPADSVNIRFGVFNVAADRLDFLIMDSFRALGGQSLLHESVFDTVAPPSGTLVAEYPSGVAGKGPVVLSFTDFTQFESAAFNTDPDTYDNPNFGATVEDLDQTVIELVYSSNVPGSRRCEGTLAFDAALNTAIANIVQVFP
jgi:hypothetical protein